MASPTDGLTLAYEEHFDESIPNLKFRYVMPNGDLLEQGQGQDGVFLLSGQYGMNVFVWDNSSVLRLQSLALNAAAKAANSWAKYANALITTQRIFAMQHGYCEGRIRFNPVPGAFYSLWMFGEADSNKVNDWPGELDQFEWIGSNPGMLHIWGNDFPLAQCGVTSVSDWNTYGVLVDDKGFHYYVNGKLILERPDGTKVISKAWNTQNRYALVKCDFSADWPGHYTTDTPNAWLDIDRLAFYTPDGLNRTGDSTGYSTWDGPKPKGCTYGPTPNPTPTPTPTAITVNWGPDAPIDGATITTPISFTVVLTGPVLNVELLPGGGGYAPVYARGVLAADGASALITLDPAAFPAGPVPVKVVVFNSAFGTTATQEVRSSLRTWTARALPTPTPKVNPVVTSVEVTDSLIILHYR